MASFHLPDAWAKQGFVRHAVDPATGAIAWEAFTPVHPSPDRQALPQPQQHHLPLAYVSPYASSAEYADHRHPPPAYVSPYASSAYYHAEHHHPHPTPQGTPSSQSQQYILDNVLPISESERPPRRISVTTDPGVTGTTAPNRPHSDRGRIEHLSPWDHSFQQQIAENEALRIEAIASLQRQEKQLNNDGSWQSYKNVRMQQLIQASEVARPANTHAAVVTEDTVVDTLETRPDLHHPVFFEASSVQHEIGGFDGALDRLLDGKAESNPSLKLPIQNSKVNEHAKSGELQEWPLSDVRARLDTNHDSLHPVNGLDLTPLKPVLPRCLQSLSFMQDLVQPWRNMKASAHLTRRPKTATSAKLEKLVKSASPWVTVAQVGSDGAALTLPHRDADGLDTYLLCAQGIVGFIWLESPSAMVVRTFVSYPSTLPFGSQWRLTFLRPGQAVYFPAGLVHAVVRLPSTEERPQDHTLLLGSHFLRPMCIATMAQLCKEQMQNPSIVNEDPYDTSVPLLARIGLYISGNEDKVEHFGGAGAVNEFWKTLSSIDSRLDKSKLAARTTGSTLVHFVPQIKTQRP